jgi:hypothetical protein
MRQDARRHILAVLLLAAGVGLVQVAVALRPTTTSYEVDFSGIPMELLGLKGSEVPDDPKVAAYLEAEAMRTLRYGRPPMVLEVSLIYGAAWRTIHTPEGCLPAHGWRVVSSRATEIPMAEDAPHPGPLYAKLMRAERGDEAQLVLFVFAHKGGTAADWVYHSWAVQTGPRGAGGLSLMIAAPALPGQEDQTEALMRRFMRAIYPHAVKFWYT